jgi:hypothetical protein
VPAKLQQKKIAEMADASVVQDIVDSMTNRLVGDLDAISTILIGARHSNEPVTSLEKALATFSRELVIAIGSLPLRGIITTF